MSNQISKDINSEVKKLLEERDQIAKEHFCYFGFYSRSEAVIQLSDERLSDERALLFCYLNKLKGHDCCTDEDGFVEGDPDKFLKELNRHIQFEKHLRDEYFFRKENFVQLSYLQCLKDLEEMKQEDRNRRAIAKLTKKSSNPPRKLKKPARV